MAAALLQPHITLSLRPALRPLLASTARTLCTAVPKSAPQEKTAPQKEHYDVIIGGGGMVGTALATAMGKNKALADKRVLLLEGAPPFKGFNATAQYGNRVSAINNASIRLFQKMGIWERMLAARVKSVKQMQVWDASSDAAIEFQHDHFAADVACIVENDLMLDAMYTELKNLPNVEVRNLSRIERVTLPKATHTDWSEVTLKATEEADAATFTCDLLVGADGANSLVRKEMAMDVFTVDYETTGIVATMEVSESGDNSVAWQRFIPTGPLALLPLSDKMSSLVWTTSVDHARQLIAMPTEEFVFAVNEAFYKEYPKNEFVVKALGALNAFMGNSVPGGPRQLPPRITGMVENSRGCFPLGFLHAASYVCPGAALMGDAAHRIHPMAGQGVNLGYSDVLHLVDALAEAAYAGAKLGNKQYLSKYEQKSLTKNVPIMVGVHGMQRLYSTTSSPIVMLRSLGLQFTQNVPQIKNLFMQRALG